MNAVVVELFVLACLVVVNGLLALAEIAVVASRKPRLQRLAEGGNRRAQVALALAESPAEFLATVQVGITLVGVLSGAFAGTTIAEQLAEVLSHAPVIGAYAESLAIGLVVVTITYVSLIIGELVPKRIALNNPERVGLLVARPMRLLSRLTSPVVHLLSVSTDVVLRLFKVRPPAEPSVTEEEVRLMVRQGATAGVFARDQQEMIDQVFRLGSLRLSAIMTPRTDVIPILTADTVGSITEKLTHHRHTHYPLCEESLDNVLGVVSTADLLMESLSGREVNVRGCARDLVSLPEHLSALEGLRLLKTTGSQIGLVIDEFGGTQGIVTMDDFGGAIVGLAPASEVPQFTRRTDGSLLVDGLLPIADLMEQIVLPGMPSEDTRGFSTVGGFVLAQLGRIPVPGDSFQMDGCRFEVLDMDGLRVDKVLIIPPQS